MSLTNRGALWDAESVAASEQTSTVITFQNKRGFTVFLLCTQDSTYILEAHKFGAWRTFKTGSINANELRIIDVDFFIPSLRVKVTPLSSGTLHGDVDSYS